MISNGNFGLYSREKLFFILKFMLVISVKSAHVSKALVKWLMIVDDS